MSLHDPSQRRGKIGGLAMALAAALTLALTGQAWSQASKVQGGHRGQAPSQDRTNVQNRGDRPAPNDTRAGGDTRDQRPDENQVGNRAAMPGDGEDARMMVGHALGMAIEGSSLLMSARETVSSAAADTGHQPPRPNAEWIQQLQQEARHAMQDSDHLMQEARRNLGGNERGAEAAGAGGHVGSPQRLHAAAEQYIRTLTALAGEPMNAGAGRKRAGTLSSGDVAAIMLINHSVKESLDACTIRTLTRERADGSAAADQLLRHARTMESKSSQAIQRLASHHGGGTEVGNGRAGTAGVHRNANAPGAREAGAGEVSVQTLAQQARELVDLIQESHGRQVERGQAPERGHTNPR